MSDQTSEMQMQEKPNLHQCRLVDLFLMMSCASVCLVASQWVEAAEHIIFEMGPNPCLMTVFFQARAILFGLATAAFISLAIRRLKQGSRLMHSPGNWLLLSIVMCGLLESLGRISLLYAVSSGTNPEIETITAIPCASFAAEMIVFMAAIPMTRGLSWRLAFGCMAADCLLEFGYMLNSNYMRLPIYYIWDYAANPSRLVAVLVVLTMVRNACREKTDWYDLVAIGVSVFISFTRHGGLAYILQFL